jgi:UDPglucose--hexose-1-phosphate uridylyltransferase
MSEIRKDSIVDRWVIIAKNRASRPNEYESVRQHHTDKPCPFCEGNEALATPEIVAYRDAGSKPNQPGWRVRVIPNKFPAVELGGDLASTGIHEVIIETPKHVVSTTDLSSAELVDVLRIYRDRLRAAAEQPAIKHGLIFKNVGPAAGASIEHAHSQLLALPIVPSAIAEELAASQAYFNESGKCIFCTLIESEMASSARVVLETESFLAFCPFAARFPFETWLVPKQHAVHFAAIGAQEMTELAGVLRSCIENIGRAAGQADYNYLIHTSPFDMHPESHYHWHIEILPRMTTQAGFEWGSGCFINPVPPEEAAQLLREE